MLITIRKARQSLKQNERIIRSKRSALNDFVKRYFYTHSQIRIGQLSINLLLFSEEMTELKIQIETGFETEQDLKKSLQQLEGKKLESLHWSGF